jgi:putative salt-induced outer membrane protein YdiY
MVTHSGWALAKPFDSMSCHRTTGECFPAERRRIHETTSAAIPQRCKAFVPSIPKYYLHRALAGSVSVQQIGLSISPPTRIIAGVKMIVRNFVLLGDSRVLFLTLLTLLLCFPAQANRKDVVVMNNGDHFTGQVKRLQNGLLFVETEYVSGSIALDWNQVQSVQSTATYRIVLNNGKRIEGKIEKVSGENAKKQDFLIREATEEVQVPSTEIVSIETKKPTFWRQLQGSIDLGYAFASGNSQTTLDVNTNAAYRTAGWEAATAYDSTFGGQAGAPKTNRQDLQGTFAKYLNRNSYLMVLSDFLHSSRQDLTLRTTLGAGYGRYLKRTTNSNLSWLAGVVFVNESFDTAAAQPSDQSAEALVGLQYSMIRFDFGEFDSQLLTFPGLTDSGRIRLTTNNSLNIKLRNNFHLAFTFWDNFDSRPPATAKRNELGVSSGIGWSF